MQHARHAVLEGEDKRPVSAHSRVQQSLFSVKPHQYSNNEDEQDLDLDLDAIFEDEDNKTEGEWEKWGERGNTPEYDRLGR